MHTPGLMGLLSSLTGGGLTGEVQTDSPALVKVRALSKTPLKSQSGPDGTRVPCVPRDACGKGALSYTKSEVVLFC